MKRIWSSTLLTCLIILASCTTSPTQPLVEPLPGTHTPTFSPVVAPPTTLAYLPNPASAFCEEQGYELEILTAADGSQSGVCMFPDGSECDEWAYFRNECGPASQNSTNAVPTEIPTAMAIDPADYQGWWTYSHPVYNFSIMLPADWVVIEVTSSDPLMNGHTLSLGGQVSTGGSENIRMTFRRVGEDIPLWPTGVGQGEFIQQGTLDVAGQPAQRLLLVCPTGEITSIWYHDADCQPNIQRGGLEFGFIFRKDSHCVPGESLGGKVQRMGEMIIASLSVP